MPAFTVKPKPSDEIIMYRCLKCSVEWWEKIPPDGISCLPGHTRVLCMCDTCEIAYVATGGKSV